MPFTIAIIGRPNVGKSTLFNRLSGKRQAIVHDTPGVTRDRRESITQIGSLGCKLIDTAGLDDTIKGSMEDRMREQTERAIKQADIMLFLIDARTGLTPVDSYFAKSLRAHNKPVILLANKCEGGAGEAGQIEAYALGLGPPIPVSAEHGQGISNLIDALSTASEALISHEQIHDPSDIETVNSEQPLLLAIIGRPNVGKSTIVNYLLGEDRMLTGADAGITRDSITTNLRWKDRSIHLVDTAGIRRQAKLHEKLEKLSVRDSLRAIQYAEVAALVLDSNAILDKQDLTIARKVIEEGRALIIAVNKWDIAKDRKRSIQRLQDRLNTSLPQVRGIPVVTCSAKIGEGMDRILPAVYETYAVWNARISTGELNRWFAMMLESHPPPMVAGRRLRLRYITQVKARPPTFSIFSGRADKIPESYLRYLANGLREDFGLIGTPLRLNTRKRNNPYHKKN